MEPTPKIVFEKTDREYMESRALAVKLATQGRSLAQIPSVYLLTRSPRSPASKFIMTHLDLYSERGIDVYIIYHRIDHRGASQQAVDYFREFYGDKVTDNIRLAKFVEVAEMFEELQFGSHKAWSGKRMKERFGDDVFEEHIDSDVKPGELAMFQSTFGQIWSASTSFTKALGYSGDSPTKYGLRRRA